MHQSGLAIKHYTHAVQYVIHTLNHLPNRALNYKSTPYIEIFKKVPDVSYFRTFGCDAYMVLPENKRPSFGLRAVKGIFLGYSNPNSFNRKSLAYRILFEGTIYETGHVYFNEDMSHTTPSDELQKNINLLFESINKNPTINHTPAPFEIDPLIFEGPVVGRDSSNKPTSAANNPSERAIGQSSAQSLQSVSARTRSQSRSSIQANISKFNRRKHRHSKKPSRSKKRKGHSRANMYGLSSSISVQQVQSAILSNNQY